MKTNSIQFDEETNDLIESIIQSKAKLSQAENKIKELVKCVCVTTRSIKKDEANRSIKGMYVGVGITIIPANREIMQKIEDIMEVHGYKKSHEGSSDSCDFYYNLN